MPLCEHENDRFKHCTYVGIGCVAPSHPQGSDGSFAFFALFIQLVVAPFPLAVLRFMQPTAGAWHSTYLAKHTLATELHMAINDKWGFFVLMALPFSTSLILMAPAEVACRLNNRGSVIGGKKKIGNFHKILFYLSLLILSTKQLFVKDCDKCEASTRRRVNHSSYTCLTLICASVLK